MENGNIEKSTFTEESNIQQIEVCLFTRNLKRLENLDKYLNISCSQFAINILNGEYIKLLVHNRVLPMIDMIDILDRSEDAYEKIHSIVQESLSKAGPDKAPYRCLEYLLIGYALLELYCQSNYTGPELSSANIIELFGPDEGQRSVSIALAGLESDGNYPFRSCQLPQLLFLSRCILLSLLDSKRFSWRRGILLDEAGNILFPLREEKTSDTTDMFANMRYWMCCRSCIVHLRLLQRPEHNLNPTLWKESCEMFEKTEKVLTSPRFFPLVHGHSAHDNEDEGHLYDPRDADILLSQFYLEKGLSYHHFEYKDKVSYLFKNILFIYFVV